MLSQKTNESSFNRLKFKKVMLVNCNFIVGYFYLRLSSALVKTRNLLFIKYD